MSKPGRHASWHAFYVTVYGILQGQWPRLCSLCINVAEVEAHDYEALEPQSRLIKKLKDVSPVVVVAAVADGLRFVWFASNTAPVTLQDPIVQLQLQHVMFVRLLNGEEVVPFLVDDCRQLPRAATGVPTHEQAPDCLRVCHALGVEKPLKQP